MRRNSPCKMTNQLTNFIPHSCCASSQVIFKEFPDETVKNQDLPEGWIGSKCTEQCDTVTRDRRGTAVTLV